MAHSHLYLISASTISCSIGMTFHSTEQYLFYKLALLFDDPATETKILAANTPCECKSLNRSVKNFDFQKWKEHARNIMKQGLLANLASILHALKH